MRNVANLNPGLAEICRLHYYSLLNALALAVTPRLASSLLIGKATYTHFSDVYHHASKRWTTQVRAIEAIMTEAILMRAGYQLL